MVLTDKWFSIMAESDNGMPLFVAGRDGIENFINTGKFKERLEIYWKYTPAYNGMPSDHDGVLMEEVTNTLKKAMEKDKLAILTGLYTGNGERTFVFYCRKASIVGERLNESLEKFEMLPIEIYVENDIEWSEYHEMCEAKPLSE